MNTFEDAEKNLLDTLQKLERDINIMGLDSTVVEGLRRWHPTLLSNLAQAILKVAEERKHDGRISWLHDIYVSGTK